MDAWARMLAGAGAGVRELGVGRCSHLVGPLSVIEVVLASRGGDEGREVPVVAKAATKRLLLEDRHHQRQRAQANENARRQECCTPGQRRLHALKRDRVGGVGDLIVVGLRTAPARATTLSR